MFIRRSRGLLLAAAIATLSTPTLAVSDEVDLLDALATATIAGVARGDVSARGTLGILLDLPEPWAGSVLASVERSNVIAALDELRAASRGRERHELGSLSQRIATLQGASTRLAALTAPLGEVTVDLSSVNAQWLLVTGHPEAPGELTVQSSTCTPDIVAFPGTASLPARPMDGQVRLTAQLASIPSSGPLALRITRGDCEEAAVTLQLGHGAARAAFAGLDSPLRTHFPAIEVDQLTVIPLDRRSAETFSLRTETGFVYELYAAPLAEDVDPALLRVDPHKSGSYLDASDDDGWQLGARLSPFVGTGGVEKFALIRSNAGRGDVALLIRRDAVPSFDSHTRLAVAESQPTWRRLTLPAGAWSLTTTDLRPEFDPQLTVYDGSSGAELGTNDDAEEGSLAARVLIQLERPTDIVIRIDSIIGEGECTLEAAPAARPAVERDTVRRAKPSTVST